MRQPALTRLLIRRGLLVAALIACTAIALAAAPAELPPTATASRSPAED